MSSLSILAAQLSNKPASLILSEDAAKHLLDLRENQHLQYIALNEAHLKLHDALHSAQEALVALKERLIHAGEALESQVQSERYAEYRRIQQCLTDHGNTIEEARFATGKGLTS